MKGKRVSHAPQGALAEGPAGAKGILCVPCCWGSHPPATRRAQHPALRDAHEHLATWATTSKLTHVLGQLNAPTRTLGRLGSLRDHRLASWWPQESPDQMASLSPPHPLSVVLSSNPAPGGGGLHRNCGALSRTTAARGPRPDPKLGTRAQRAFQLPLRPPRPPM